MQKITPSLWFDGQASVAADFYVSVFRNSRIVRKTYYPEGSPGQECQRAPKTSHL